MISLNFENYENLLSSKNMQLAKKEHSLQELIKSNESLSESLAELEEKLAEALKEVQTLTEQKNVVFSLYTLNLKFPEIFF